jgi:hypothetical protein
VPLSLFSSSLRLLVPKRKFNVSLAVSPILPCVYHRCCNNSKILDRVLFAALGAVLLLLFGGGLSKALRLILYVGCALLPILLPFSKACLHNTRLRTHPYTGVFLGATTSSATPIAAGRIRVSIADVDGEAAAEGTADSASGRVRLGMVGFALVVADDAGFGRFRGVGAVYVPEAGAWVGDYPYVRRRYFQEVSVHADLVARASPWQSGA